MTLEERMKRVRSKALRSQRSAEGRKRGASAPVEEEKANPGEDLNTGAMSDMLSNVGTTGHRSDMGSTSGGHRSLSIRTSTQFQSNKSGSSSASSNRTSVFSDLGDYSYDSDSESVASISREEEQDLSGFMNGFEDEYGTKHKRRGDHLPSAIRTLSSPPSVTAEIESTANSLFLTVKEAPEGTEPYRITNSSSSMVISFKQRGTDGHPWIYLQPGEEIAYMWEEPMKPRKLNLRICEIDMFGRLGGGRSQSRKKKKKLWGVDGEYDNNGSYGQCKVIKLDEIGFTDSVPKVGVREDDKENSLWCSILADGPTKVLKITDREGSKEEEQEFNRYRDTIKKEVRVCEEKTRGACEERSDEALRIPGNSLHSSLTRF